MSNIKHAAVRAGVTSLILAGAVLSIAMFSAQTRAAELTQTMDVRLEVITNCSVATTAVDLDFGSHVNYGQPITAPIEQEATLQVTCNQDEAWSVYADQGQNVSGAQRRVRNDATNEWVPYDLFSDASRNVPFSTSAADPLAFTGTGDAQDVVIYGRIPTNTQLGGAGNYRDTVVMTFSF